MSDVLDLLALIFIPAVTAAGIASALVLLVPSAARHFLPGAIAAGFLAGCFLYPDRLPIVPERHWHWLPQLGLIAAVIGGLSIAGRLPWWGRSLLFLLLGGIAAWFLVPTWDTLQPSRPVMMPLLAVYLALLATGLANLPERLRGRHFLALLTIAAAGVAVLVTSDVSLRMGAVSLRVATALGGCWAASWLLKSTDQTAFPLVTAAVVPVYVVLSGGSLFTAAIEPSKPLYLLFLVPAAPLTLWLFAWGPLAKLEGLAAIVAQSMVVLAIPVTMLAVSLLKSEPQDEWSSLDRTRSTVSCIAGSSLACFQPARAVILKRLLDSTR